MPAKTDQPTSGIFIVEPDGSLRVALGAGCTLDTYPGVTKKLTPDEIQQIYTLTRKAGLLAAREQYAPEAKPPCFQIVVIARSERIRTDMPLELSGWVIQPAEALPDKPNGGKGKTQAEQDSPARKTTEDRLPAEALLKELMRQSGLVMRRVKTPLRK